jgi:hypothetical protein
MRTRSIGRLALAGLLAVCATAAAAPAGARPVADASRTCQPPKNPANGYFMSLEVRRTSCRRGRRVVLDHYACRTESGPAGRCHRRVRGYRCREHRNTIPIEIDSRVTCRRGARRVIYTYQQNLRVY